MWESSKIPFSGARTVVCGYCDRVFAGLFRSLRMVVHALSDHDPFGEDTP